MACETQQRCGDENHRDGHEAEIGLVRHQHVMAPAQHAKSTIPIAICTSVSGPPGNVTCQPSRPITRRLHPDPRDISGEHGEQHKRHHAIAPQWHLIERAAACGACKIPSPSTVALPSQNVRPATKQILVTSTTTNPSLNRCGNAPAPPENTLAPTLCPTA